MQQGPYANPSISSLSPCGKSTAGNILPSTNRIWLKAK